MEESSRYIWQVAGLFATLIIAMAFLAVILFTVKRVGYNFSVRNDLGPRCPFICYFLFH